MPAWKLCPFPGCGEKTTGGPCEKHKGSGGEVRGSAASRGYGHAWRVFRARYLKKHPLCVRCDAKGVTTVATDVHHKRKLVAHPELKFAEENLEALCHECHSEATARGE